MARKKSEAGADDQGAEAPLSPSSPPQTTVADAAETPVVSEVMASIGPENRPLPTAELLRAEAGDVKAEAVTMERAGAEQVTAQRVIMNNSGARTVDASSAQIDRSGILAVRSDKSVLYHSTVVAMAADEARIVNGKVLLLKAENATIEGGAKIAVYAGPTAPGLRPLVDVQSAAAFGAGLGAALLLLGAILRRVFR